MLFSCIVALQELHAHRERGAEAWHASKASKVRVLHVAAAVKAVCSEYRIHNADVYVRDDSVTVDDLVDVIEGSRVYVPAIYVINKIDQARAPPQQGSCFQKLACGHACCY